MCKIVVVAIGREEQVTSVVRAIFLSHSMKGCDGRDIYTHT